MVWVPFASQPQNVLATSRRLSGEFRTCNVCIPARKYFTFYRTQHCIAGIVTIIMINRVSTDLVHSHRVHIPRNISSLPRV